MHPDATERNYGAWSQCELVIHVNSRLKWYPSWVWCTSELVNVVVPLTFQYMIKVVGLLGLSACSASVDRFQTAFVRSMSTKTTSSSKEWLVRPSTLDDEEEINKLLGLSYGKLLTADYDAKLLAKSLPVLTTSKKELLTCGTWYVAQDMMDHSIVGCGGWTERNPFNESVDCPQLRHFATHPDAIRQGVGRAIWNRVWEDVSNKLGPATPLAVFSTLGAKAFYESIGFVEVERMCVELADDCMFPGIMMRREGNIG